MKKGRKYINKDGVNKVIDPEELPYYLNDGWSLGNTNASHKGMTAWNKGLTKDTSTSVAKISSSKIGVKRGEEFSKHISDVLTGRTLSEEHKRKISQSHVGRLISEESKQKMSQSKMGHEVSKETRRKISNSKIDQHHSEEAKKKISSAMKSRIVLQETKDRLSVIHKDPKFQEKFNETKRQHNTFNTLLPEELYYNSLIQIYGEDDIIRQYKDTRYPFNCDFYIKSLDQFIELNLHWTHCGHPYNSESDEDAKLLEELKIKAETSDFYKKAIYVWTELDVKKQQIAKENHLNYEVIYEL